CYGERLRLKNPKLASLKQRIFPSRFVFPLRGRSPAEAFPRKLCFLLGWPILPVKTKSVCYIGVGIGNHKSFDYFWIKPKVGLIYFF
ncbi:hypothetical protein, partial [uncultured Parabacteroides sp.]